MAETKKKRRRKKEGPFRWPDAKKREAIDLFAEGRFGSVRKLAEHIGVPHKTVERWKEVGIPEDWGPAKEEYREEVRKRAQDAAVKAKVDDIHEARLRHRRLGRAAQAVAARALKQYGDKLEKGDDVGEMFKSGESAARTAKIGTEIELTALEQATEKVDANVTVQLEQLFTEMSDDDRIAAFRELEDAAGDHSEGAGPRSAGGGAGAGATDDSGDS